MSWVTHNQNYFYDFDKLDWIWIEFYETSTFSHKNSWRWLLQNGNGSQQLGWIGYEMFGFFLLSFPQNERKIYWFRSVVYFLREVCLLFNFSVQKLKSKRSSPKKYKKLSKTNIFFSRFEGTRGERNQLFCTFVFCNVILLTLLIFFTFEYVTKLRILSEI